VVLGWERILLTNSETGKGGRGLSPGSWPLFLTLITGRREKKNWPTVKREEKRRGL